MSAVAAVVYVAHNRDFLGTLEATDALLYILTKDGVLHAHRGPERKLIARIPASHVVWVGVPPKWVKKLGDLPFKSRFVGTPLRWHRMTSTAPAIAEIKSAYQDVQNDTHQAKMRYNTHQAALFHKAQLAVLHSPSPWYIPQELR